MCRLVTAVEAGEQPPPVEAAQKCRPMKLNVLGNDLGQLRVEAKLEIHAIFDFVFGVVEVEGSVGAAKSCEILVEACADEIADADWREGQHGNRDCHLSLD